MSDFIFDNTYARELEGMYVPWQGAAFAKPELVKVNTGMADELGLEAEALSAAVLSGAEAPVGAQPLAMAYAGHQFGGFSPQLGDGRALLVGEVLDRHGKRQDLHLKGSGKTPFSRGGDGKAVLGPVLREYLMGEAMHALGIPTTRALGAVTTGEQVLRDQGVKKGAVLARVASSHLRVGTFQFFAARGEEDKLRRLADYAIARHDPDLAGAEGCYLEFFSRVVARQAGLIAAWMGVGFVHGVMNTDNMTISGETIDYGPCAFVDAYNPKAVFSSIDAQGRYAFANQPTIAQWNLARLAEALLPLIDGEDERAIALATERLGAFMPAFEEGYARVMSAKLGLDGSELWVELLELMHKGRADYTAAMRALAALAEGDAAPFEAEFVEPEAVRGWAARYQAAGPDAVAVRAANPVYVPRNHLVEEALAAADEGDLSAFDALLGAVGEPYETRAGFERYERGAPESFGRYVTYCGT